LDELGIAIKK